MTTLDIYALADSLTADEERWLLLAADFQARRYSDYVLVPADPEYQIAVLMLARLGVFTRAERGGRVVYTLTERGQQVVDVLGQPVAGSEVQSD